MEAPVTRATSSSRPADWVWTALVASISSATALLGVWILLIAPHLRDVRPPAGARDAAALARIDAELAAQRQILEELLAARPAPAAAPANAAPAAPARDAVTAMLEEDLASVGMVKVAVTGFLLSNGRPPKDNAEAGLPSAEEFRGGLLRTLTIDDGTIALDFGLQDGGAGHARLVPEATDYSVRWRCTTDFPDIEKVLPGCAAGSEI